MEMQKIDTETPNENDNYDNGNGETRESNNTEIAMIKNRMTQVKTCLRVLTLYIVNWENLFSRTTLGIKKEHKQLNDMLKRLEDNLRIEEVVRRSFLTHEQREQEDSVFPEIQDAIGKPLTTTEIGKKLNEKIHPMELPVFRLLLKNVTCFSMDVAELVIRYCSDFIKLEKIPPSSNILLTKTLLPSRVFQENLTSIRQLEENESIKYSMPYYYLQEKLTVATLRIHFFGKNLIYFAKETVRGDFDFDVDARNNDRSKITYSWRRLHPIQSYIGIVEMLNYESVITVRLIYDSSDPEQIGKDSYFSSLVKHQHDMETTGNLLQLNSLSNLHDVTQDVNRITNQWSSEQKIMSECLDVLGYNHMTSCFIVAMFLVGSERLHEFAGESRRILWLYGSYLADFEMVHSKQYKRERSIINKFTDETNEFF